MKKVIVASTNPVKLEVAQRAFAAVFQDEQFEFISIESQSGVPHQPMNNETRKGAYNRLNFITGKHPEADFWISQEGGSHQDGERLFNRAWIIIRDKDGFIAESSTAQFYLPKQIAKDLQAGMELGDATDKFFNEKNTKQGKGAVGYLTDDIINRTEYYLPAAIIALSEIKHKEWYV